MGYITDYSRFLVSRIVQSQNAHESTGASLYGPDLSKWPVEFYDALLIINAEEAALRNERDKLAGG